MKNKYSLQDPPALERSRRLYQLTFQLNGAWRMALGVPGSTRALRSLHSAMRETSTLLALADAEVRRADMAKVEKRQ